MGREPNQQLQGEFNRVSKVFKFRRVGRVSKVSFDTQLENIARLQVTLKRFSFANKQLPLFAVKPVSQSAPESKTD